MDKLGTLYDSSAKLYYRISPASGVAVIGINTLFLFTLPDIN